MGRGRPRRSPTKKKETPVKKVPKTDVPEEESEEDTGNKMEVAVATEGAEEELPLVEQLALYKQLILSTIDTAKDELESLEKRKIQPNNAILKKEKRSAVVLSKIIVTGFKDSITKLSKDLQHITTTMAEGLHRRFDLPEDWMQINSSCQSSRTGSELGGPTFSKKNLESHLTKLVEEQNGDSLKDTKRRVNPVTIKKTERNDKSSSRRSIDEEIGNDSLMEVIETSDTEGVEEKKVDDEEDDDCGDTPEIIPASRSSVQEKDEEKNNKRSSDGEDNAIKEMGSDPLMEVIETNETEGIEKKKVDDEEDDDCGDTPEIRPTSRSSVQEKSEEKNKKWSSDGEDNEIKEMGSDPLMEVIETSETEGVEERKVDDEEDDDCGDTPEIRPASRSSVQEESEEKTKKWSSDGEDNAIKEMDSDPLMEVFETSETEGVEEKKVDDEEDDDCGDTPEIRPTSRSSVQEKGEEKNKKWSSDGEDNEIKPGSSKSTVKKEAKSRSRSTRKISKDERDAMKDVLQSSSDDNSGDDSDSRKKRLRPLRISKKKKDDASEKKTKKKVVDTDDKSWRDDPKLELNAAKVVVEKLDPSILKTLKKDNFIKLEGYRQLKQLIGKSDDVAVESSSDDSDDSIKKYKRELKKMQRNSIVTTKKYKQKNEKQQKVSERTTRKKRGKSCDNHQSREDDDDSDDEDDQKNSLRRNPGNNLTVDISSSSGAEDLDPESDDNPNKRKTRSTAASSKKQSSTNKKRYISTKGGSSDSENDDMKAVLGSSSEKDSSGSDSEKKSSIKKRKKKSSSGSDSDFVAIKKRVRKRKKSNTDSSVVLSDSDSDFKPSKKSKKRKDKDDSSDSGDKKKKKKRRRIVQNDSGASDNSSDSDIKEVSNDDDDEDGSPSQKGRKNIRKILSDKELKKTTREAEKEEEERRKRLSQRQEMFNGIHEAPENNKIERLVLDVDPETKEPVLEVDETIAVKLKPHQAEGIKFMYNACFESIEMIKQNKTPGGCILAHCMGLGKTLQTVAFLHTLLTNEICGIKTALVICPLSTVNNWFNEVKQWTRHNNCKDVKIHKLFEAKNTMKDRRDYLQGWQRRGGIGILHYDMFRRLADPKGKTKMKDGDRKAIKEALLDPGPDIVVCDEGHLLKNCKSILSIAVSNIKTLRRVVLTGTPLQNNLVEYHTMMNFVKPNLLGSLPEFTNRFVNPIKNGQHADSTDYDVKIMKRRAHVLHGKLEGCVQRRDYSILAPYLPPKYEYIINIKLSPKQEELYKYFLSSQVETDFVVRRRRLLKYYAQLVKIWSHPIALEMRKDKDDDETTSEDEGSMKDFIVDESTTEEEESKSETESNAGSTESKKHKRSTRANHNPDDLKPENTKEAPTDKSKWWNHVFKSKSEMYDVNLSGKLVVLQEILKTCEAIGDKVLVFSQFLSSLDIIEEFLRDWDEESVKKEKEDPSSSMTFPLSSLGIEGRWRRNVEYFRIDGKTKVLDRHRDCEKFNRKSYSKAKLFLISTRAGGLGINLYGANRVVIFDASWNPSQDMQSIFRVYRFGQDKPCYIYRLIAKGTMEEKILRRQITKLSLSSRVVDEHQIERHFKFDDVNEMYVYDEEDPSKEEEVFAVPKDRLLADLLISHKDWIRGYEQFDSLLENKPDEGLTNEEKELAWQEYREDVKQRQRTFAPAESDTLVKVKGKLIMNYPYATPIQLESAARLCVQVIEKIRAWMLIQNQLQTLEQRDLIKPYMDPMKQWLQQTVSPGEPKGPVPPNMVITPAVPREFLLPVRLPPELIAYSQYPQFNFNNLNNARPPQFRMHQPQVQAPPLRNIRHNFQNAVNALRQPAPPMFELTPD